MLAGGDELTADGGDPAADPHRHRDRHRPGHARRARALREAPRGAGRAVRPARRARHAVRRAGPARPASRCSRASWPSPPSAASGVAARRPGPRPRRASLDLLGTIRTALDTLRARGGRDLHRLDDPRRRRPLRGRRAGPRGRAGRHRHATTRAGDGPDRLRAALRDRRRARGGRARCSSALLERPGVPPRGRGPRRRAGDHARLLRLLQGRRHRRLAVADPPRPAGAARHRPRARRGAAALPRPRRLGRSRRRPDRRGDPVASPTAAWTGRSRSPSRAR